MAWGTMPNFVDGTMVDEGDLDPMVDNINDLRNSLRVLRGKWIQKAGNIITGIATAELTVPDIHLDNVTVETNQRYVFFYNLYMFTTVADASWFIRVRKGTPLTGAVVISTTYFGPVQNGDDARAFMLPWTAASNETTTYYLSIQRIGGNPSLLSVRGDGQTAGFVCRAGDSATGVWTTVT